MLSGEKKLIRELLIGCKYSLVNNQREYVWSLGSGQIEDFLYDIKYYSEHPEERWFLGQIVLLTRNENGTEAYKIIDGQQRLTTICLFLAACRNKARALNNTAQQSTMQDYISFKNGVDGSVEGIRLYPSKTIQDIFESICTSADFEYQQPEGVSVTEWRKQLKIIKKIFEEFNAFLADVSQAQFNSIVKALLEAYVFRLISDDPAETYSLFENTNAKGTPLEATDLLKNLLIAEMQDDARVEADWNEIAANSGSTGVRMLKYYYTATKGTLERGNIYRKVRDNLVRNRAGSFLPEYKLFSILYSTLENEITEQSLREMLNEAFQCEPILQHEPSLKRIFHAIQGMQLLGVVLCYPMMHSMLRAYMRNENTDGNRRLLVQVFQSIEKFHFVNTYICDSRANRVETLYAEFCGKFNNSNNNFAGCASQLLTKLKAYTAEEDIFCSNFKELEYNTANLSRNTILYYIFDRFNNYDENAGRLVDPGAWIPYYAPTKNMRRHVFSLDHCSPQNPRDRRPIENVHNIGNLYIIGTELNGRLNNLSPEEKIQKLKTQYYQDIGNNKMLKEAVDGNYVGWDEGKVAARALNLAQRAYRKVWRI